MKNNAGQPDSTTDLVVELSLMVAHTEGLIAALKRARTILEGSQIEWEVDNLILLAESLKGHNRDLVQILIPDTIN